MERGPGQRRHHPRVPGEPGQVTNHSAASRHVTPGSPLIGCRVSAAMVPPQTRQLQAYCDQGFRDAMAFLQAAEEVRCSQCSQGE